MKIQDNRPGKKYVSLRKQPYCTIGVTKEGEVVMRVQNTHTLDKSNDGFVSLSTHDKGVWYSFALNKDKQVQVVTPTLVIEE